MTFTQIQTEILDRLNLSSSTATSRIGRAINRKYRLVTSAIGLELSRRASVQATVTIGVSELVWTNTEKIVNVFNRSVSPYRRLDEMTVDELRAVQPFTASDSPTQYAILSQTSDTITILLNCIPQTAFALYADIYQAVSDLSGVNEPAFPESFHDVLIEGVLSDELRKMEKPQLAQIAQNEYDRILSDLKFWVAKSAYLDMYQGKTSPDSSLRSPAASSGAGSGSSVNGALSYTQTGLITFDRDPSAPFAVTAASAKVTNLDADKLDGQDWTSPTITTPTIASFVNSTHNHQNAAGGGTLAEAALVLSDLTTDDVSSTKHGFAPKSPADATKFLNGAATPAFAQVKDSDLSTSDVTTNNVVSTKHGFAPKSPADATQFLNGAATPAFAAVKDSDLSFSDILTNNVSTTKHGFVPKAPNSNTQFLDGTGAFSTSGQIPFPAAQNASAGANVLDDYEEGTWTPVLGGSGGTSGQTYSAQTGHYVKIGKLVFASFNIVFTSKGTITGTLELQGLPFTIENISNHAPAISIGGWGGLVTALYWLGGNGTPNTTTAAIRALTAAAGSTVTLTTADVQASSQIFGHIFYRASA